MDNTLSGYLKALRTPAGAPPQGRVQWNKKDLFGDESRVEVEWGEDTLRVAGTDPQGQWDIHSRRTQEGWDLESASPRVLGGTLLAKLRWAGKRVEEAAQGTTPLTSWTIPRKGSRRGMAP